MNYPARLLPQSNYKKIEWSTDLCPLFLLRYTPTRDFLDDSNKVKDECIVKQTDHLRDLSTNLLGNFGVEDSKIEVLESGKDFFEEWHDGQKISEPIYNSVLQFSHTDHIDNNVYQLNFKVLHTPKHYMK